MGGRGSGRSGGNATVEGTRSIKLSVHDIMRGFDGTNPLGKRLEWSGGVEGQLTAIVRPQGAFPPLVELRYRVDHYSRDTGEQTQYVDVRSTPCRFGGRRWWWECPKSGKRVEKLYLPNGGVRFLSREAYRLDYQSQRETAEDRAQRKSRRLYRKLGPDAEDCDYYPKPKGMHWRTFNTICEQLDQASEVSNNGFFARIARLIGK